MLVRTLPLFLLSAITFVAGTTYAQSLTDGLRLSREQLNTGVRNHGMAGAMITDVNDYSALYWNPAALAPIEFKEVGLSLFDRNHHSDAMYLGQTTNDQMDATSFSSLGFVYPARTRRGHLAFGMSFDLVADYTNSYKFKAINPNSSLLNTERFLDDPKRFGMADYEAYLDKNNLAWALHLTPGVDSAFPNLETPFKGGLEQSGAVREEGGLHAFRVGAAIDIAEKLSVGGTFSLYTGNYDYRRVYTESDVNGLYANDSLLPVGFQSATITDRVHQSQSGLGLKLGLLSTALDVFHFGLTVETPTAFRVSHEFQRSGVSRFSERTFESNSTMETPIVNEYDVVTPWRFGAGGSLHLLGAVIAGSISYADMKQLSFDNADVDLTDLEDAAKDRLHGVLSWHLGAEYILPFLGSAVRAGISREPSAFVNDAKEYDQQTISLGASILLSKSTVLNASYQNVKFRTDHSVYNDYTPTGDFVSAGVNIDDVSRNEFMLGIGIRF